MNENENTTNEYDFSANSLIIAYLNLTANP
jgi:hypothetical protein